MNQTPRRTLVSLVLLLASSLAVPAARAHHGPPYPTGPDHAHGQMVAYPMVFPVGGTNTFSDSFYSPRCCDPGEIHHAIDLMAAKMVPVYAVVNGTVESVNWSHSAEGIDPTRCCTLGIRHDDGWETWYIHLNNDTPGTDDGKGWGVADLVPGDRVTAGQLIGWVGDSGNAEYTSPHLHFELIDPHGVRVNPYKALRTARDQGGLPRCRGVNATIFGDSDGDGTITGTDGDDVIVGTVGDDLINAGEGDDLVCGGTGRDVIDGGPGEDTISGGGGTDILEGGDGADVITGGRGNDRILGGIGDDTLSGDDGSDALIGGSGGDDLRGGAGNDRMYGGSGDDVITGDADTDLGNGGPGLDRCVVETPTACEP